MRPLISALLLILGIAIGMGIERAGRHAPAPSGTPPAGSEAGGAGREVLYWWDPMIPDYRSDQPGLSPMGMEMVPVYAGETEGSADPDVVTIAPEVVNNLGVRIARASLGPLERRIDRWAMSTTTKAGFITYTCAPKAGSSVSWSRPRAKEWGRGSCSSNCMHRRS